ncbi:MAG: hypothetical protein JNK82_32490 [Myxococcaceae bacterium]|nr:hypothetical protein [Myxococcaceae bacterium]
MSCLGARLNLNDLTPGLQSQYQNCVERQELAWCGSDLAGYLMHVSPSPAWEKEGERLAVEGCERRDISMCLELGRYRAAKGDWANALAPLRQSCNLDDETCVAAAQVVIAHPGCPREDAAWLGEKVAAFCATSPQSTSCVRSGAQVRAALGAVRSGADPREALCATGDVAGCFYAAEARIASGQPVPDAVWQPVARGGTGNQVLMMAMTLGRPLPGKAYEDALMACLGYAQCGGFGGLRDVGKVPPEPELSEIRARVVKVFDSCSEARTACAQLDSAPCGQKQRTCRMARELYTLGYLVAKDDGKAKQLYLTVCPKGADDEQRDPICKATFGRPKRIFERGPCAMPGSDVRRLMERIAQTANEPAERFRAAQSLMWKCRGKESDADSDCDQVPPGLATELEAFTKASEQRVGPAPCDPGTTVAVREWQLSNCKKGVTCLFNDDRVRTVNDPLVQYGTKTHSVTFGGNCGDDGSQYQAWVRKVTDQVERDAAKWPGLSFDICAVKPKK